MEDQIQFVSEVPEKNVKSVNKFHTALLAVGILALIFVVIWAAGYFLQFLVTDLGFVDQITAQFDVVKVYFTWEALTDFFTDWNNATWMEIGCYNCVIALIICLILAIIFASVKKRPMVFVSYICLIVLVYGVFEMAYYCEATIDIINDVSSDWESIYNVAYLGVWLVACVLSVCFWVIECCSAFSPCVEKTCKCVCEEETEEETFVTTDGTVFTAEDVEPEPVPMFLAEPEPEVEEPVEEVEEETPVEETPAPEPVPGPTPIVVNTPAAPAPTVIVTPVPTAAPADSTSVGNLSRDELVSLLREIVRETVRDEVARSNENEEEVAGTVSDSSTQSHSLTGASFGGPLVVQYFNGPIPGPHPCPDECHEEPCEEGTEDPFASDAPTPVVVNVYNTGAPVAHDAVVKQVVAPTPAPKPVAPKPAPVAPVVAPKEDTTNKIVRIPFTDRILAADEETKSNYNVLKNTLLSYGVKSRISNSGDTFRLHRKTYVKITVAGKSLKLYFALNPEDYRESTIPVQDAGAKGVYEDIPLVFKVKSSLSLRRAIQLIADCVEKDDLEQGEVGEVDWVHEIKVSQKD